MNPSLSAWAVDGELVQLDDGLINVTWRVEPQEGPPFILQRLNTDIFVPEVHEDIEAVTTHLAQKGLETPRLVRTRAGALWHTDAEGGVWRLLTFHGDRTVHELGDPQDARSAGALIGRFHSAVADLDWRFRSVRPGAHDTDAHFARLAGALDTHREHRLHAEVAELAVEIREAWARWSGPTNLPARILHGDLKISNVRFAGSRAVCLVDLDTLARGTLDLELGDALRSWCNRASEDAVEAELDHGLFAAALEGWCSTGSATPDERASWVPGLWRICLELACRFARDALEESYFGWNPAFGGRGEHNLIRARGQASLARRVEADRPALDAIVARL